MWLFHLNLLEGALCVQEPLQPDVWIAVIDEHNYQRVTEKQNQR